MPSEPTQMPPAATHTTPHSSSRSPPNAFRALTPAPSRPTPPQWMEAGLPAATHSFCIQLVLLSSGWEHRCPQVHTRPEESKAARNTQLLCSVKTCPFLLDTWFPATYREQVSTGHDRRQTPTVGKEKHNQHKPSSERAGQPARTVWLPRSRFS